MSFWKQELTKTSPKSRSIQNLDELDLKFHKKINKKNCFRTLMEFLSSLTYSKKHKNIWYDSLGFKGLKDNSGLLQHSFYTFWPIWALLSAIGYIGYNNIISVLTKWIAEMCEHGNITKTKLDGVRAQAFRWSDRFGSSSQVSQTYLEEETKVNSEIITQTVCCKHPSQFTDRLTCSTSNCYTYQDLIFLVVYSSLN